MKPQFVTIDGLRIRVRRHELSGAPTLLLTCAMPQSIRCWESSWDELASKFSLLAVDLPGFGLSEGREQLFRPSAQAHFLLRILDYYQIDRVHGVGPDIGVPIMLYLALEAPHRVDSVTIFDGPGYWPPALGPGTDVIVHSRLARAVLDGPLAWPYQQFLYLVATRLGYRRYRPTVAARNEYREVAARSFRAINAYLGSYRDELPALGKRLGQITVPTLITWGDWDPFVLLDNAQRLHERIPGSTLSVLTDCGHYAHEDAGAEFTQLLSRFVEGVSASAMNQSA